MKTDPKASKSAPAKTTNPKRSSTEVQIKTDFPLSEKDEVKKAEKKLGESQKKQG